MAEKNSALERGREEIQQKTAAMSGENEFLRGENSNLKLNNDILAKENDNLRRNNQEYTFFFEDFFFGRIHFTHDSITRLMKILKEFKELEKQSLSYGTLQKKVLQIEEEVSFSPKYQSKTAISLEIKARERNEQP